MPTIKVVCVNAQGRRIGLSHPNAWISEEVIKSLRDLNEIGIGYRRLSAIFQISRSTIAKICRGERRAQLPYRTKRIVIDD